MSGDGSGDGNGGIVLKLISMQEKVANFLAKEKESNQLWVKGQQIIEK